MDDYNRSLSPPLPLLRLKRLKKASTVQNKSTVEISLSNPPLVDSPHDFEKETIENLEESATHSNNLPAESTDEFQYLESSDGFKAGDGPEKMEERREAKRVLDFADVDLGLGDFSDSKENEKKSTNETAPSFSSELQLLESPKGFDVGDGSEMVEECRDAKRVLNFGDLHEEGVVEVSNKEKKKTKRSRGVDDEDEKAKSSISSKRREEKERKVYLLQLHAESQKLLRETRDATFKPIPVVHKPISSVLEKIRKRKLELTKKTIGHNSDSSFSENNAPFREVDDLENVSTEKREADNLPEVLQDETVPLETNRLKETSIQLEDEDSPSRMEVLDDQPVHAFRAPIDDTQDLFSDSQTSQGKEDTSSECDQNSSPLEGVFAPSLLEMNLKFDSAPLDDISSDEEDNDKENVKPHPDKTNNRCSSPEGDPVRAFVDEEAEEEDNSDNDMRFQENEEDDFEDYEELKDLIATGFEENPVDNDMRNELHQKWLEQQDATGTDNLMQRLKYGSKLKESALFEDEQDEDLEDDENFCDEAAEDPLKASVARISIRKAKQMIPRLFSGKDDGYVSEEEEAEKKITKQLLLQKVEKQTTLVPPAEDEHSREVFGLIKRLNIVPDTKKKAKISSIFDKMPEGGKVHRNSKSSFIGRRGKHSLPSSNKQGTSGVRSFIFGRDDSNSRGSLSISEDSSDVTMEEIQPTRNVKTKLSSSQIRISSQVTKSTTETSTGGGSLFEILKRSSVQSNVSTVGLTQTVFDAFKIPKNSLRIERRF